MGKISAGDFITITERHVSDKVQQVLKVGGIYHVNHLDKLQDGTAVLVIDKDVKKRTTIRANAKRFTWKKLSEKETLKMVAESNIKKGSAALERKFPIDEQFKMAIVPMCIASMAWKYAQKSVDYARINKIDSLRKVSREVKDLHEHYYAEVRKDLDLSHYNEIENNVIRFLNEYRADMQKMYFCVVNSIFGQWLDVDSVEMRANAIIAMQLVDLSEKYIRKNSARVSAIFHYNIEMYKIPYFSELYGIMAGYLEGHKIELSQDARNSMAVFCNNINNLKFEVSHGK